ncbi:MAG: ParA family protein [Gammaproteobacteria bacterium]|nr:ParA family protein [Gammaproteobacteria bacterium]
MLNPKGGCGKTTLTTNLASYFALRGPMPTIMDCDPQGGSMRWLEKRHPNRPPIHGIAAYKKTMSATRSWQQRIPMESNRLLVDTPAALSNPDIHELIYDATNVLIPVMPSPIDIRYAARFIADLLLVSQLDRRECHVGIVASRTRQNTRSLRQLMRFVNSLRIPVLTILRDSQNYVHAAGQGIGIYEMPHHKVKRDIEDLARVVSWLNRWEVQQPQSEATAETGTFVRPPHRPMQF